MVEKNHNSILPSSNRKHYQLNVPSSLVYSNDNDEMVHCILSLCSKHITPIILCCQENAKFYSGKNVITVASKYDLAQYSKNLFSCLHNACSFHPDWILIEGVNKEGLGLAIMNRLENICLEHFIM